LYLSNLKSVALTVLELLAFNAQTGLIERSAAHTHRHVERSDVPVGLPPAPIGGRWQYIIANREPLQCIHYAILISGFGNIGYIRHVSVSAATAAPIRTARVQ